jgi:hypothetical protein
MLQLAPMFGGKIGIAAAVRLERGFIVLQAVDEAQDRRFILGQPGIADTNGRAP